MYLDDSLTEAELTDANETIRDNRDDPFADVRGEGSSAGYRHGSINLGRTYRSRHATVKPIAYDYR
jgi:hypothetical protein